MENLNDYPDVLTPKHLRDILHIGMNKVYELLRNGEIKSIRIGAKYRIPKKWFYLFLLNPKPI